MTRNISFYWCAAVIIALLGACASSNTEYTGTRYEPTQQVETIFQVSQAPQSCRVFAHLFATMPAGMTTGEFAGRLTGEAQARGADVVLIGQARQSTGESSLTFAYYGPVIEYSIGEWSGWSFGLENWSEQGTWTPIGYGEWMQGDVHYDYPAVMQTAFLRCRN